MYFRFPILLIILFAALFGLVYLMTDFQGNITAANGEVRTTSANDLVSSEAGVESIRETQLRAHLEFLADDLLEGRDTGSRGARVAGNYIAAQFEGLGLKPGGDNNTYFQHLQFHQRKVSSNSVLNIEVDGEMYPLKYGKDFLVVIAPEGKFEFDGELVFTGFGIQAPEYDYDDFKDVDVKGKITVYMTGEPSSDDEGFFEGKESTKYSDGATKRRIAQSLGARGAIGILQPDWLKETPWRAFRNFFGSSRTTLVSADAEKREQTRLPAVILHPNVGDLLFDGTEHKFEDIVEGASKGQLSSFQMEKRTRIRLYLEKKEIEDRNVIGLIEGSDPVLKSEVVVYTAHYDHVGIGTPVRGDSVYNGAADNASGVAGLLEVAEAFSQLLEPPKRSLLFLAVTAEEKGLLGSEYYVNHPVFPISKTVANFNFDIIGIGDTTGIVVYGSERSTLGDVVKKAAEQVGLKILPDELPEERIYYRSDHYSFAKKGVPAIFAAFGIDRGSFEKFEKYYHQPSDEVDLPFNYHYMKQHVQAVFLAGLWVANSDKRPEWKPGDEFGKIRQEHNNE